MTIFPDRSTPARSAAKRRPVRLIILTVLIDMHRLDDVIFIIQLQLARSAPHAPALHWGPICLPHSRQLHVLPAAPALAALAIAPPPDPLFALAPDVSLVLELLGLPAGDGGGGGALEGGGGAGAAGRGFEGAEAEDAGDEGPEVGDVGDDDGGGGFARIPV